MVSARPNWYVRLGLRPLRIWSRLGGRLVGCAAPLGEQAVRGIPNTLVPRSETRSHRRCSWEENSAARTSHEGNSEHTCSSVGDQVPQGLFCGRTTPLHEHAVRENIPTKPNPIQKSPHARLKMHGARGTEIPAQFRHLALIRQMLVTPTCGKTRKRTRHRSNAETAAAIRFGCKPYPMCPPSPRTASRQRPART